MATFIACVLLKSVSDPDCHRLNQPPSHTGGGAPAHRHVRSMMKLNKLVVKLGYKILNMNGKFCIRNKLFEKQSTADENICR